MKKIIWSIIVLIILAAATYFFVFKNESEDNEMYEYYPNVSNETSTTTTKNDDTTKIETDIKISVNTEVGVAISNFAFSPSELHIKAGTKVTWTNDDTAPHDITQTNGNTLKSQTLHKGEKFSFTFNTSGTYEYICSIHPMMKAKVIVE